MDFLVGQPPEGAQERDEEQRLLPIGARRPTRSGWQGRWAASVGYLDGNVAQRQQMQLGH